MNDWINVEDHLPKNNQIVLVSYRWLEGSGQTYGYLTDDNQWFTQRHDALIDDHVMSWGACRVEFWMDAPLPPKHKTKC